jgi:protein MpaA
MYGGPTPASEPETRAVISVVKEFQPTRIVTIHSISGHRQCNNYDGPGRALARKMSHINGYPVSDAIGYPTPGSFGHWAGVELGIATITLELPSHHSAKRCWEDNRLALRFAT